MLIIYVLLYNSYLICDCSHPGIAKMPEYTGNIERNISFNDIVVMSFTKPIHYYDRHNNMTIRLTII